MKKWLKITLLCIAILINVLLAYQPHFSYPYPILGDEYVHISFGKYISEEHKLPFSNPYLYNEPPYLNFESGFHFFLALMFLLIPRNPIFFYKFFIPIFMIINSLLIFYLMNLWFKNFLTSLFSVIFYGMIKSTEDFLAHIYFLPLTFGITFLLLSFIFFHKWEEHKTRKHFWSLIISLAILAASYPPALFFFLGTIFLYLLSTEHKINEIFSITRRKFLKHYIIFSAAATLIFILVLKLLNFISYLTFDPSWTAVKSNLSPIFFFGIIPSLFALIGLMTIIKNKKNKILFFWFLFSIIQIYFFYIFDFTILVPFRRLFFFYLIGIAMLAGVGASKIISYSAKFKFNANSRIPHIKKIAFILIVLLIIINYNITPTPELGKSFLDDDLYDALKFIQSSYSGKINVVINSADALTVYPTSGKKVLGMISSVVGGGSPEGVQYFFSNNCKLKKQIAINVLDFLNEQGHSDARLLILSEKEISCDFLKEVYSDGVFIYELD